VVEKELERKELQRILSEIQERNYALIEFPLSWSRLKDVADNFLEFLQLPYEAKSKFTAPHKDDPNGLIGYQRRDKGKGNFETKEFFNYHESILDMFPDLKASKDPVVRKFIDSVQEVYKSAVSTFKQLLDHFSHEEPGMHSHYFKDGSFPRYFIRFLKYDEVPQGGQVAAGHYDRGGLALALAESAPGLRIWKDGTPLEVDHKDGCAVFMPGITFNDTTSKIKLSKTWHDAIQKVPNYKPGVSRWAIIFFADPLEQRSVSVAEARTKAI